MAATRNRTAPDDDGGGTDTESSGFSEDQRSELRSIIAEVVGAAKPPAADPDKPKEPRVSDAEWDRMGDRQRESWVRSLVDFRLDELSRDDELRRHAADIEALKADKTPEKEGTPEPSSPLDKLRKLLWGEQK